MTTASVSHPNDEKIVEWLSIARRLALRWVEADADADDVAQEAVLRLVESTVFPSKPVAWLFVVTRRLALRQRRSRAIRRNAELAFSEDGSPPSSETIHLEVDAILRRLTPRQRNILLLVAEQHTASEIAAILGCAVTDVGQMVARARRRARKLRGEDAFHEPRHKTRAGGIPSIDSAASAEREVRPRSRR